MDQPELRDLPLELAPHESLLTYYILSSLVLGPFFPILLIPNFLKYQSLRYTLDHDGLSVRWGVFSRREISLNYARIQDLHLSSNVLERWLGIGKIQVQTASAGADAEMLIEGLTDSNQLRDFLYARMRGAKGEPPPALGASGTGGDAPLPGFAPSANETATPSDPQLDRALRDVALELRAVADQLRELRDDLKAQ